MNAHRIATAAVVGIAAVTVSAAASSHVTPTVVLVKQADVIRRSLKSAQRYFVRTVEVGRDDLARIRTDVSFKAEDPEVKFYYGQDSDQRTVGVVIFSQANTQHGPVEVGLAIDPDGRVSSAIVTKATVETKPWVLEAVRQGLMNGFVGMHYGDDTQQAVAQLSKAELGAMPYYFAQVTARAVEQGLVLHHVLYRTEG